MRGLLGSDTGRAGRTPPLQDVATGDAEEGVDVEFPTVGRIVHLRIDFDDPEPVLRSALVLERGDYPGWLRVQVFLLPDDPVFPGSRIKTTAPGCFTAVVPFGPELGEWRWPERADEPDTFVSTV